jgi:hypothetical protein
MTRATLLFSTVFLMSVLTLGAQAQGLTVVLSQTGAGPQPVQQVLQAGPTKARFDVPGMGQVFYNAETKTLRVAPALMKAYMEYTPDSVKQAVAAGRGAPASAKITYKRTGTGKVRQWPCTTYEGVRGTEKVVELCVAAGAEIAVNAADFKLAQEAIDLARGFTAQDTLNGIPVYGTVEKQGFAGFPVRRTTFAAGKQVSTTELTEIRREAIPAANLELPAGYVKVGQ